MYEKLKIKLQKLINKNKKTTKYEEILLKFNIKLEKLKIKDDSISREEVEIVKKLIQKIENKIQVEGKR